MELRLGGEVQVFRSNYGARESGVDGLEVRLLDAPFLRPQQKTRIDRSPLAVQANHNIMATEKWCTFLGVWGSFFLYERSQWDIYSRKVPVYVYICRIRYVT